MRKATIGVSVIVLLFMVVGCQGRPKIIFPQGPNGSQNATIQNTTDGAPVVEYSSNIGVILPAGYNVTYEGGFVPIVSRAKAVSIARETLHDNFLRDRYVNIVPENYPLQATVALYSGPDGPPNYETLIGVKVWIIVVTGLPYTGSGGPMDPRPFTFVVQDNIVMDANTGRIIYEEDTAQKVYLDTTQNITMTSREEAIDIARNWLEGSYGAKTANSPVNATVSVFGNMAVWNITFAAVTGVAITGGLPAEGVPPPRPFTIVYSGNAVIDKKMGAILAGGIGAQVIYLNK